MSCEYGASSIVPMTGHSRRRLSSAGRGVARMGDKFLGGIL
jgi:hypothetical protein